MGRIDPKLIIEGEESSIKIVKYKGQTAIEHGTKHVHKFVVYEDDTIEIFDHHHKDPTTGQVTKHTHEYLGEYPGGYISFTTIGHDEERHKHNIKSVSQPIKLGKKIYGKKSYSEVIDKTFSEFVSQENIISIEEFFDHYRKMFYEIPRNGENSHKAIIDESTDYLGDFIDSRDAEIVDLTTTIVELERKLSEAEEADKEHPIFTNGSFLKHADNPTVWYMDKGAKRGIADWETYLVLKRVNGHAIDKDNEEVWILVTEDVIKGLETGPKFRSEDLYGDVEQREKEEEKRLIELDPDDFIADPSNYETPSHYIEALDRETRQLLAKEEYMQELYYRYKHDSTQVANSEEKAEATERFGEIRQQLYNLRRKILKYTDILESVDPDGDLQNLTIDTSALKSVVESKMSKGDTEFTQAELQQLRSKENKIERFLDSQGRATYQRPSNRTPSTGGGGGGGVDTSSYLGAAGFGAAGGITAENFPTSPPKGYQQNDRKTVGNHSAGEAIRKMRLGAKSSGGQYYWSLKYKSTTSQKTHKLENPAWKLYTVALLNPITAAVAIKPVSRYYWRTWQFEWLPMPGTIPGIKSRNWNGKTIHKLNG